MVCLVGFDELIERTPVDKPYKLGKDRLSGESAILQHTLKCGNSKVGKGTPSGGLFHGTCVSRQPCEEPAGFD